MGGARVQALASTRHTVERHHLDDQQIQYVGLDTQSILNWPRQIVGNLVLVDMITARAVLDFSVNMLHALFEHNIDAGTSLVIGDRYLGQVLATGTAAIDLGNCFGFNRAAVVGLLIALRHSFLVRAWCCRTLVLCRLGGRDAEVLAGFLCRSLHEDRQQHVHDHQQGVEEHPSFIRYFSSLTQAGNFLLDACDLFPN